MANIETGEIEWLTDEQFEKLEPTKKSKLVPLTENESDFLNKMNRKNRRAWLKKNKKPSLTS